MQTDQITRQRSPEARATGLGIKLLPPSELQTTAAGRAGRGCRAHTHLHPALPLSLAGHGLQVCETVSYPVTAMQRGCFASRETIQAPRRSLTGGICPAERVGGSSQGAVKPFATLRVPLFPSIPASVELLVIPQLPEASFSISASRK